jgi:hypothetical protein
VGALLYLSKVKETMEKRGNMKTLSEDLRVSFKFAAKNMISFVLGVIGVLIVTGLLIVLGGVVVMLAALLALGWDGLLSAFASLEVFFSGTTTVGMISMGLLLAIPFLAPFMVAMGALFGMGREIVESAGTTAQGVFAWYRSKFFPLAAGGLLMFAIAVLPIGALFYVVDTVVGLSSGGLGPALVSGVSVVWLFLSIGMTLMVAPGIIDGMPVIKALKQSVRLSIQYFDRIYSTWLAFIIIELLAIAPVAAAGILTAYGFGVAVALLALLGGIGAIASFLLVFPALIIAVSRVYMILTGSEVPPSTEQEPGISFVGGV